MVKCESLIQQRTLKPDCRMQSSIMATGLIIFQDG